MGSIPAGSTIRNASRTEKVQLAFFILYASNSFLAFINPKKSRAKNTTNYVLEFVLFPYGAEKRIRTSGRVTPVTRFPIVLLKPLRHLCTEQKLFYNNFAKNATSFYTLSPFFRLRNEKIFLSMYFPVPVHKSTTSFLLVRSL